MGTVQELFDNLPRYFRPENAAGVNATFQFDLSGEGGGQWAVTIADGQLRTQTGATGAPDLTVQTSADDWLALVNGELSPMAAFMQGRVQMTGNMALITQMQSLFRRPE